MLARASRSTTPRSTFLASRHFASTRISRDEAGPSAVAASPKIEGIVDSISTLSLLEVSELVTALKVGVIYLVGGFGTSSELGVAVLHVLFRRCCRLADHATGRLGACWGVS